jgi:dienelactone hydrolase
MVDDRESPWSWSALVKVQDVRESGLVGTLFLAETAGPTPAVMCLAGAAGGTPTAPAAALAKEGFAALALATQAVEGRPPIIERFPLEYCFAAVAWLRQTVKPASGFVAVRGHSRGGQLALLMAVLQPDDIDAVLAYNPVTYVSLAPRNPYAFDDPAAPPAWTWRGKPVEGSASDPNVLSLGEKAGLEDSHAIALHRAKCPILLISGDDDPGIGDGSHGRKSSEWSCIHAVRRLKQARYPYPYQHLAYQSAGHQLAGPPPWNGDLAAGGTREGNERAVDDSWVKSLNFLRAALVSCPKRSSYGDGL